MKLVLMALLALDFSVVDASFSKASTAEEYAQCKNTLVKMLHEATTDAERCEVNWRLSRLSVVTEDFEAGIRYGEKAISQDPSNEKAYMWHCANVGRESQQHNLAYQAKQVGVLMEDLTTILDKLGKTGYSEAWQALAEIYWAHPFKSSDAAINYARRAASTIPSGELRLGTYVFLAKLLEGRNLSAGKRESSRKTSARKFSRSGGSAIERYAYYDGAPAGQWPWKSEGLSDREEAVAILRYAQGLYLGQKAPHPLDTREYQALTKYLKLWQ